MKLYAGIFAAALGVILVLAGGNGAAFKLWAVLFGKGLPTDPNSVTDPKNVVNPPGQKTLTPGNLPPGVVIGPTTNPPGTTPEAWKGPAFNGQNTLTGAGLA